MPAKHLSLELDVRHFAAWLDLWDFNCRCYLEPVEAKEMSRLAHEIGAGLSNIVFQQAFLEHRGHKPGAPF